jgi:DNA polymerase V
MTDAFGLVDCNNFYASAERVFNPKLDKKPVIVLSNNDGCIISRSDEARQIGVKMGAPLFKAQNLLDENDAEIFSSNYELYGDMSARFMGTLREFTPEIEVYSIDEAFLGFDSKRDNLNEIGFGIKEKVKKWTGLPTSVGIAQTKTLAKLANRIARNSQKAKGVLNLYKSPYLNEALKITEVGSIWGISGKTVEKLLRHNIKTAFELSALDLRQARKLLSVVGARIVLELRGVSCLPLESVSPMRRSITCSKSFGQTIETFGQMREAISVFISRAAEKLRKQNLAAKSVTVFIATDRFYSQPSYYSNAFTRSSAYPTDTNFELQKLAFSCLEKVFKAEYIYRKAGVILSDLVPADNLNGRLFDEEKWRRFRDVIQAVDKINGKFGRDTIRFAVANSEGVWQGKCAHRSNRYTTRFDEILTVT